jgi:hypothetical protein
MSLNFARFQHSNLSRQQENTNDESPGPNLMLATGNDASGTRISCRILVKGAASLGCTPDLLELIYRRAVLRSKGNL